MNEIQKEREELRFVRKIAEALQNAFRVPQLEERIEDLQRQLDERVPKRWHTIKSLMEAGFKRETARRIMLTRGIKGPQWFIEESEVEPALKELERGSEPLDPETRRRLFELNDKRDRERQAKKKRKQG